MVQAKYMGRRLLLLSAAVLMGGLGAQARGQQQPVQPKEAPTEQTAQPTLETPQQTNARIRTLSGNAKAVQHEYLIGNGDLLSITVFDVPELTRDVRVNQSGSISLPLVPVRLQVSGMTELQAEQKIAEVLGANGLVTHAEVGVVVKEHRSKPITIVGAVMHPMVYEADRPVTLLEALAEAGGVSNDAGDTVIISRTHAMTFVEIPNPEEVPDPTAPGSSKDQGPSSGATAASQDAGKAAFPNAADIPTTPAVTADPKSPATVPAPATTGAKQASTITVNLDELLESGDMKNNIMLQAGDVVTVPHAGIVYVLGAVTRPGGFVVANDRNQLTAMKVLALAGGLTRIAKVQHAFIVRQNDQGKQTETEVDLKKILNRQAEDIPMKASDVLYIPDDRVKEVVLQTIQLAIAIGSNVAIYRLAYH